jgi:hypothetical protein
LGHAAIRSRLPAERAGVAVQALTPAVRRKSAPAVLHNVKQLQQVCGTFCTALRDVVVSVERASRRVERAKT